MNKDTSHVTTKTAKATGHMAIAALATMIGLGLVACADAKSSGTPVPVTTETGAKSETKTTRTTATSSPTKANSLADTDPCELLTDADRSSLGVTKTEGPEKLGTARICRFRTPEGGFTPGIRTNVGLAGVVVKGPVTDIAVGSHQAKQMRSDDTGGCTVFIGVTASSRVDVVVQDRQGDQDEACELALRAAKLIEPNLPES